jgi:flagellar hook-associated protein 1 FlgK
MSDMLSIGASGVRAYQVALSTVSDNIANSGTTGYTRRTTSISEVGSTGSVTGQSGFDGMGSVVTGVVRVGDDFRAAEVRSTGADLAKTEASVTWLGRIEDTMGGSQLGTSLGSFFNAATQLSADPTSSAARSTMMEAATGVANAFSETGAALDQASSDIDSMATDSAASLTTIAATLAQINQGLGRAQPGSAGQATLLDQRDQALEQMSALTDTTVTLDAAGRATVHAGGSGGPLLVQNANSATITYARNSSGSVQFSVLNGATQQSMTPSSGALAGIVEGAQKVADAQGQLASVAKSFVDDMNGVQAGGRDLSNNPGAPMFALDPDGTAQVTMTMTDPSTIAAGVAGGGQRDNTNLATLAALRTSGGYENAIVDLTTTNAATLAQRNSVADAQTTIHNNAVNQRDSQSGVSLDNEAVDLMRFQQAYSASGRVIQTARDIFQTIININ